MKAEMREVAASFFRGKFHHKNQDAEHLATIMQVVTAIPHTNSWTIYRAVFRAEELFWLDLAWK
jgi:hypothetical protein